ncbi:histidine--tRNA ligase [Niabella terrae]
MKPSIPQGTRDFDAITVRKRQYILQTIREVFELHGYQPLETPAMENLDTLMGKYGEEGDRLIFKILNNGLGDPKNAAKASEAFEKVLQGKNDRNLTERALRYDLTIPFARYVAMHHQQLPMPFKRYQMQPVWRADRPQKGRYREFYQCDADVVGSTSLFNELELAGIYSQVFNRLKIPVEIRINNRKILAALADVCGGADQLTDITIAIDKLDKIGLDRVMEELRNRGLQESQVAPIARFLGIEGNAAEKLTQLDQLLGNHILGAAGIAELRYLADHFDTTGSGASSLLIDPTLARGLNYYTGTIFEIKALGVQMGSIGGGGRYDDLTGLFGVPKVPGVGISFGVDRIYDVLEELELFPDAVQSGTKVLFFNLGENESLKALELAARLRARAVPAELFPDAVKFDKQFKYADRKGIPFVAILGSQELATGIVTIKELATGKQHAVAFEELAGFSF